jgi:hypothetical protein
VLFDTTLPTWLHSLMTGVDARLLKKPSLHSASESLPNPISETL